MSTWQQDRWDRGLANGLGMALALDWIVHRAGLYPADGHGSCCLTEKAVDKEGITLVRTTRGETPLLPEPSGGFEIGSSRTLRHSDQDVITVVAAGVTVFEALRAADGVGSPTELQKS